MSLNLPHITDFTITPKGDVSLRKYVVSVLRNLPKNWNYLAKEEYIDNDSFHILNSTYCFQCVYSHYDLVRKAKMFIGIKDDSAFLLKIKFEDQREMQDRMLDINFILYWFHYSILKKNKFYDKFDHKFELGGPLDENWKKTDIRDSRSLKISSKKDSKTIFLAKGLIANVGTKDMFYFLPNNVAISLSITKKAIKKAVLLHKGLLDKSDAKIIKLYEDDKLELYDFFEEIITSITFAYISVESFTNSAIPENYTIEKNNQKGIKEIWTKQDIERWMSTSEKITNVLPQIFNSNKITDEKFWSKFTELEKLRNDIIHQKTINEGTEMDDHVFSIMLNPTVFEKIKSAIKVIEFFYKMDNTHPYFPLGLGIARMKFEEVDSIDEYLKGLTPT